MRRTKIHILAVVIVTVVLTLLPIGAAAQNQDWTENWTVDFEDAIGPQKYTPGFPRVLADGTVYLKNWPTADATHTEILAISPEGQVNWVYKTPVKELIFFVGRFFDVDTKGNLYLYYQSGNGIEVHKINKNGKLEVKFTLPDPDQEKLTERVQYKDDGTIRVVHARKNGDLYLYQLSAQGKVTWSKKIKQDYKAKWADITSSLELFGNYLIVHQPGYIDIYDSQGNKKFRFNNPNNERFEFALSKDHEWVGLGQKYDRIHGTISSRMIGLSASGKQIWSFNTTNGSRLYQFQENIIYSVTDDHDWITELVKIDPATGITVASYKPKKFLGVNNNRDYLPEVRDYLNDPYLYITQYSAYGGRDPQPTLLDPSTLKELPVNVQRSIQTEREGLHASLSPLYYQRGKETHVILWNKYEVRDYTWNGEENP